MNIWPQRILKTVCGAFLGTVIGLLGALGEAYSLVAKYPHDKAVGSQDSEAMALGLIIVGLIIVGGCVGFLIGSVTALILDVRATRRRSFSRASLSEPDFINPLSDMSSSSRFESKFFSN